MPYLTTPTKVQRKYRFVLHESNLNSQYIGAPVRELRSARSRNLNILLNRGGGISFTVPLDSNQARDIMGYEMRRCVVVYVKDSDSTSDVVVGSWPIINAQGSTDGAKLNVSCGGWQEVMGNREFLKQTIFTSLMPGDMVKRMLSSVDVQLLDESADLLQGKGLLETSVDAILSHDASSGLPAGILPPEFSGEWSKSGAMSVKLNINNPSSTWTGEYGLVMTRPTYLGGKTFATIPVADTLIDVPINSQTGQKEQALYCSLYAKTVQLSGCRLFIRAVFVDSAGNGIAGQVSQNEITGLMPAAGAEGKITVPINVPPNGVKFQLAIGMMNSNNNDGYIATIPAGAIAQCYFDAVRVWQNNFVDNARAREVNLPFDTALVDTPGGPTARTRTYSVGQKLDSSIQELSDIEGGFDYDIITERSAIPGDPQGRTQLRRRFVLNWNLLKPGSTLYGRGTNRTNVIFGKMWGPRNVKDLTQTNDASKLANRIIVRDPAGRSFVAQDLPSIEQYGLFQDTITISDAGYKDTILSAYAGAELAYRRVPFTTFAVTPKAFTGKRNVPRIFKDYFVGDLCYLVSKDPTIKVGLISQQTIRIFGATIAIDDDGNETVQSLQTTASS